MQMVKLRFSKSLRDFRLQRLLYTGTCAFVNRWGAARAVTGPSQRRKGGGKFFPVDTLEGTA
jgi:hypothetical protein